MDKGIPYRWTKVRNGIGTIAIVSIEVIPNENRNEIVEHYAGQGFSGQGHIEEVSAEGYKSWKTAAKKGLEYGFSLADTFWTVHIRKIEGQAFIETNPTVVGYTILRAFLEKIGYPLNQEEIEKLEEFVMSSWTKPHQELIPDFFTLTFTTYFPDQGSPNISFVQ